MLKIREHIYSDIRITTKNFSIIRQSLKWTDTKGITHTLCKMNENHIANTLKKIINGGYSMDLSYIKDGLTLKEWSVYFTDELIYTNNENKLIDARN